MPPKIDLQDIMTKMEDAERKRDAQHAETLAQIRSVDVTLRGNGTTDHPGLIAEVAENKRKLAAASKCAWAAATAAIGAVVAALWAVLTGNAPQQ